MHTLYIFLGLLFAALGMAGIVVPLLPTVPLYLLAALFFGKGSARLDAWFKGTSLYALRMRPLSEGRGMALKAKVQAFLAVTLLLGVGFAFMGAVPWGRAILVAAWVFHIWLFWVKIPADAPEAKEGFTHEVAEEPEAK